MKRILLGIVLMCFFSSAAYATESIAVFHFWGEGCPVCVNSKLFLEDLAQEYPQIELYIHEVWRNKENADLFRAMSQSYESASSAVPVTMIDDNLWIGYNPSIAEQIKSKIKNCLNRECISPLERLEKIFEKDEVMLSKAMATTSPGHDVCVHIFMRKECPQCEKIVAHIDSLSDRYNVFLNKYDISDQDAKNLYGQMKEKYQVTPAAFPVVFIGEWFLVGDRVIGQHLDELLSFCAKKGCPCPIESARSVTPKMPRPKDITPESGEVVLVDIFGSTRELDARNTSLPLFTLLIAGADSFNPCSFYILLILLSLITRTRSRKRMLLVGGIFISLSGIIYFLFTAAWLNLWFFMGRIYLITLIAGIIAVMVAIISIKDFFFFKKGISLGIPDSAKPKIFERMRKLLESPSLPAVIVGTVVLGVLVNLYELLCTPGFPLVYTRVLALHDLSMVQYYAYLVLYNVIYVVPLLIILVIFTITFGQKKMTEEQGKILKLISGLMMLFLGLTLIFEPTLLENFFISAGMLLSAVVVGVIIIFITKRANRK